MRIVSFECCSCFEVAHESVPCPSGEVHLLSCGLPPLGRRGHGAGGDAAAAPHPENRQGCGATQWQ